MTNKIITKDAILSRAITYQLIGFGILLVLIISKEVFNFPLNIFGIIAAPINWGHAFIEGVYISLLCVFTLYLSLRFSRRIKFLEGILPTCLVCKKIYDGKGAWKQMEVYISEHSEAQFSHGYCPECEKKAREGSGELKSKMRK